MSERKLYIETYGCQMNVVDSEVVAAILQQHRYQVTEDIEKADLVLVMSVFPGFGGQSFIESVLPKVTEIRRRFDGDLEIDGGITDETGPLAAAAGAEVFVAGTYVFGSKDYAEAIARLKKGCEKAAKET